MVMALRLLAAGDMHRRLWLYDTFTEMVAPGERDEPEVHERYAETRARGEQWVGSPIDDVRRNLMSTGFPPDRLEFVEGNVEDTIAARAPETIGLLRLDTEWYDSTRHETRAFLGPLVGRRRAHHRLLRPLAGSAGSGRRVLRKRRSRPLFGSLDCTGRLLVKR
jgi:hypothetical protein